MTEKLFRLNNLPLTTQVKMKENISAGAGILALADALITSTVLAHSEMAEELGQKGHSFVDLLANGGSHSKTFIYH